MKNLYESLLDDFDTISNNMDPIVKLNNSFKLIISTQYQNLLLVRNLMKKVYMK